MKNKINKREIKKILKQADKDSDKQCDGHCEKCKYYIAQIPCEQVHFLYWLVDHDNIIKKIKENNNE